MRGQIAVPSRSSRYVPERMRAPIAGRRVGGGVAVGCGAPRAGGPLQDGRYNAADAGDRVERLAEALGLAAPELARHLDDEEDIVIPLIALRGDPLG